MKPDVLLALTSHGNAPYLMAARFARALGSYDVLIPDYYGKAQAAILREEVPDMAARVFLSRELGDLLRPLLLDAGNTQSFADFAAVLSDPQNRAGALQIENRFQQMLRDGIPARSLDGSIVKRLDCGSIAAVINTTLPIRVQVPRSFFFFTARMSDLFSRLPPGEDGPAARQALEKLQDYASLWRAVEGTFDAEFIPRINALSYRQDIHDDRMVNTPPFAFEREIARRLTGPSVLFVTSGTRTDLEKLHRFSAVLPAGYQRLVLGSNGGNPDFPPEQFITTRADVYGDANLAWVVSRGGWGTVWECLMNFKLLAVVRTGFTEDPEIGHSQAALAALGLAVVLENRQDIQLSDSMFTGIRNRMQAERQIDRELFGPFAADGYAYIADHIHRKFDLN